MGVSLDTRPASPISADLEAIYTGGENFMARMQALSDATAANEKALKDFNLGNDINAKIEEAKTKQDAAKKATAAAAKKVADAEAQAAKIVADAKAQADDIAIAAQTYAEKVKADAAKIKADAAKTKADAKAEAAAITDEATKLQKAAVTSLRDADLAQAQANAAKKNADEKAAEFDAKIKKLTDAQDRVAAVLRDSA